MLTTKLDKLWDRLFPMPTADEVRLKTLQDTKRDRQLALRQREYYDGLIYGYDLTIKRAEGEAK
jgi:hypothetical protein